MTAVIDGQLSIFDWMEDFDPAKKAKQAAGRGFVSHFSTCPNANKHRKGKS